MSCTMTMRVCIMCTVEVRCCRIMYDGESEGRFERLQIIMKVLLKEYLSLVAVLQWILKELGYHIVLCEMSLSTAKCCENSNKYEERVL